MGTAPFVVRALTLNIWNRQGPWDHRKRLLVAGLDALRPDVIGLQEVIRSGDATQAHELSARLGHEVAFGRARPLDAHADYGNAVTSRWPIASERTVPLPCLDVDEPRSLLVTLLDTPAGRLPVLVTHFSWRLTHGYVREAQALAVAAALDELDGDLLPPLFMGDLNAAPHDDEIRFLAGELSLEGRSIHLTDAFGAVGVGDGFTFDGRHNPFAEPWKEPPRRIDYIFVDGPDAAGRGTPLSAEVVLRELDEGVAPSDHYGVLASLRYG